MTINAESGNVPTIIASIAVQQKAQNYDAFIEIIFELQEKNLENW